MLNSMEKTHVGSDKIDHYKWIVKDKKGSFAYISKHSLHIDHFNYQRDNISQSKVLQMSSEWSWAACGAIAVAKRTDGSYWVIDGQYRTMAAMKRSDIQDLPCLVFEMKNIQDEAGAFLNINANRKSMQYLNRFKAEITSGDEEAIFVKELVESSGRVVSSDNSARTVRCVGALVSWVRRGKRDVLRRIWPLLDQISKDGPIPVEFVDGFMTLEMAMQEGHSVISRKIFSRMIDIGEKEFKKSIQSATAFRGGGKAKVWAEGIVVRYNKGLQIKLPIRDGELSV